jgi:uncharacterized membrane protein YphA (DoxX/SURF4 family)
MNTYFTYIDQNIIRFCRKSFIPFARFSLALIFIWFGMLKVFGLSPAGPLVENLFQVTIPFIDFETFYILFALFEVIIGLMFIIPRFTRFVIPLLFIHMITTAGPLVLLPIETWVAPFVPTLVGQYIIKNMVIVTTAIGIAAHVHPFSEK